MLKINQYLTLLQSTPHHVVEFNQINSRILSKRSSIFCSVLTKLIDMNDYFSDVESFFMKSQINSVFIDNISFTIPKLISKFFDISEMVVSYLSNRNILIGIFGLWERIFNLLLQTMNKMMESFQDYQSVLFLHMFEFREALMIISNLWKHLNNIICNRGKIKYQSFDLILF